MRNPLWRILVLATCLFLVSAFDDDELAIEVDEGMDEEETISGLAKAGVSIDELSKIRTTSSSAVREIRHHPGEEFTDEVKKPIVTPNDVQAEEWYQQALRFLEKGRPQGIEARKAAYRLLEEAKEYGHRDSMKLMAFAHLFGDRVRWSIDESKRLFEELAQTGSPDAQLGLGFMHATAVGMTKSDQAKALIYYTFAALGGQPLAQMAVGYRYLYGIGVPQNCEQALTYYQKVAKKVADAVKFSTSPSIQRLRLTDELEGSVSASGGPMDQNLIEYYKFLADKGDVAAQVGLGQLFLTGSKGVEQDFDEAHKYRLALISSYIFFPVFHNCR
ncbi:unnamed protein product, partial [Mesorhabditis belari]|uniref:Uncharacterized protein n=1 Tax=Mesorhabditis belari TaxID=2138241 RepID=A0AAF3FUT8_9BILA